MELRKIQSGNGAKVDLDEFCPLMLSSNAAAPSENLPMHFSDTSGEEAEDLLEAVAAHAPFFAKYDGLLEAAAGAGIVG